MNKPAYREIETPRASFSDELLIAFIHGEELVARSADALNVSIDHTNGVAIVAVAQRHAGQALFVEQTVPEIEALVAALTTALATLRS